MSMKVALITKTTIALQTKKRIRKAQRKAEQKKQRVPKNSSAVANQRRRMKKESSIGMSGMIPITFSSRF